MKTENKKIVSVINLNSEEKNKIIKKYMNISPMLCSCGDFARLSPSRLSMANLAKAIVDLLSLT